MRLCEHVEWAEEAEGVRVVAGTAVPVYGWSKELEADVPLLRCSECRAAVRMHGTPVFTNRVASPNRAWEGGWELL